MTIPEPLEDHGTSLDRGAHERSVRAETHWARRIYLRWILPRVGDPLVRQRIKLLWFMWGYWRFLGDRAFSVAVRCAS